jgi:hypothetical protein
MTGVDQQKIRRMRTGFVADAAVRSGRWRVGCGEGVWGRRGWRWRRRIWFAASASWSSAGQLNAAWLGQGELGVREADATQRAQQSVGGAGKTTAAAGWPAWSPPAAVGEQVEPAFIP